MDFSFTEEQNMLRDNLRKFCRRELTEEFVRWMDENVDYPPQDLWKKIADLGILGIDIPEKYGGSNLGLIEKVIVIEEFSRVSTSVALAVGTTLGLGGRLITLTGNEEQKKKYLPKIASGDLKFSFALTEPAGGTDILRVISTTAVPDGDDFIINGQKIFVSGAHNADYINTTVLTDKDAPKRTNALSIFIVDPKSPGVTIRKINKLSIKGFNACEVFFEDVRVPKENLLGSLNKGWVYLLPILNPERVWVAALSLGVSEAVLQDAVQYSKERIAFGKPIGQFMAVQHMIADMALDIELARNLIYKCACMWEQKMDIRVEALMAKLFASDRAVIHAINGMEILGGYGVCMEYNMQRYLRDSKQMPFSPLNNEMCRNLIAESFELPRSY